MEAYLNRSIKEVIKEFPPVEKILDEYGIGCGPCAAGLCLLKDIVSIHNLPPEEEQQMMARIAQVIHPDQEIPIPQPMKKSEAKPKAIQYSPPMKKLVEEHGWIKKLVALIPEIVNNLDVESEEGRKQILGVVDFIRSYADKFHHAKEEQILFKYFDETLDLLKVMHEDHTQARGHGRAILEALEKRDRKAVVEHLSAYRELLTEHIKKEDEILYPWMDRQFSISQVGELFSKFNRAEEEMGFSPQKFENFIDRLDNELK